MRHVAATFVTHLPQQVTLAEAFQFPIATPEARKGVTIFFGAVFVRVRSV